MLSSWGRTGISALCAMVLGVAGCSDSKDGHTVGGRARSVSTVDSETTAAATLRLVRAREADVPGESGSLALTLVGVSDPGAVAALPDGTQLPLLAEEGGAVARRDWTSDPGSLAGSYTALWHDGATRRALTLIAAGEFPAFAAVDAPPSLALLDPASVTVSWTGPAEADVRLERIPDGAVVFDRSGQASPLQLPPLEGGQRYRLTVTSASGPAREDVRWESRRSSLFDTVN